MPRVDMQTPFHKVLVANRGEIARRIVRTLRRMGLASVAVFSDADRRSPHVAEADEAVRLGPAPSAESYLCHDAVIRAARAVGAGAIHPGYGFLAENADFAARCLTEGLVFIGPTPEAIRRMGNKAEAKALARTLGVPTLEGFDVEGLGGEALHRAADGLGYPLLIKAAAGGGGKGMRAVHEPSELEEAVASARREAMAAFGDGALLAERLLVSPRHVEIQILGDVHGRVVHLFERDCSVQRRHQKVFEESPSPAVDGVLRQRLGEAAVELARAVEYRGAGTVEFLLDVGRGRDAAFYFLEMNTRLQVEHPVTEAVTGLDLVRLQVEVALGLPLGFGQDEIALSGHAIEARLYAEDPANEFLPATGRVALWEPPELPGLRIDSGIEAGSEVGIHYDPMLAKVIAHGTSREEARRRLYRGLSELAVGGLATNRDFLLAVLEHEVFCRGEATTAFVERHLPAGERSSAQGESVLGLHALAATLALFARRKAVGSPVPKGIAPGWRNNRWRGQEQVFERIGAGEGERLEVRYVAHGEHRFTFELPAGVGDDDETSWCSVAVELVEQGTGGLVIEVDGIRRRFRFAMHGAEDQRRVTVHGLGRVSELLAVPRFPERQAAAVAGGCAAPMTGKVIEVMVAEGDRVEAGDTLVVLEAMKMEHRLRAEADGVVEAVHVEVGQMVDPDMVLVVIGSPEIP